MASLVASQTTPRWLHRWAVFTVLATLPLLLLGAEVTTKQVGMVDPVGFREPWHLLVIMDRAMRELGLLIEHSHRAVGFLVGTSTIILAVGLWLREPRAWVRWLGTAALAGVCIQGILGIFRVNLNAMMGRELALVHGCFAQLVFATLVSVAVCTSRTWTTALAMKEGELRSVRNWSLLTAATIYLQLILGGFVRHTSSPLGQRGHLLVAFAVVATVLWLGKLAAESSVRPLRRTAYLMGGLLVLQLVLGIESWMLKFASGFAMADLRPVAPREELVRTAHFLTGSALFASAIVVSLLAHRPQAVVEPMATSGVRRLEGAA